MANKPAPLFKKALKGYNKEDVNSYILFLNKSFEESKASYEAHLNDCNKRAEEDYNKICSLTSALSEAETIKRENEENLALIESLREELAKKDAEIASLTEKVAALEEQNAQHESCDEDDHAKAEYYDSLCAKAGEILVIASGTAENILNRANDEACKIVGDANSKKDLMLKTFSDSVEGAADDINSYIRTAVNECINKINASVNEVKQATAPTSKKHTTRFINGN